MTLRQQQLNSWLQSIGPYHHLTALPHDAGFRRYYRCTHQGISRVIMDWPPEDGSCEPFITLATYFANHGLPTPQIFHVDVNLGFALIEDFGDTLYQKILNENNAETLYQKAIDGLVTLHACPAKPLGQYQALDDALIQLEMDGFHEWFAQKLLQKPAIPDIMAQTSAWLCQHISAIPKVFMHRDYHSQNLLLRDNNQLGIIDFQDAMVGPITYDVVSLLRDCYIDWPEALVMKLALYYKGQAQQQGILDSISDEMFLKWFDIVGIERHLKAIFTFSRKSLRDQDDRYLQHIPRTLNHITTVGSKYPELQPLVQFLQEKDPQ